MTPPAPSERRRRLVRGLVVALVAGLTASLVPAGPATVPATARTAHVFTPTTGPTFNRPIGTPAQQRAIFTRLNKSIAATRRGSVIRMAVFSFSEKATADALLAARRRGVNVQLIFDDHTIYGQEARLRRVLGANPSRASFVVYCHRSCRGTRGNMHTKFFTFSRVGNARFVSMTGSNNITRHNAVDQWSDVYTVVDDQPLYAQFYREFQQMKWDRPVADSYRETVVGEYETQFFPSGRLAQEDDPLDQVLSEIACTGATFPGGPDSTAIRISMHAWNGDRGVYLAHRVADLEAAGCRVFVVYGVGIGTRVRNILTDAGVTMSAGTTRGVRTHQKTLSVRGVVGEDTAAKIVWTGSHNWTDGSLVRDEVILRIDDPVAWAKYHRNFTDMLNHG